MNTTIKEYNDYRNIIRERFVWRVYDYYQLSRLGIPLCNFSKTKRYKHHIGCLLLVKTQFLTRPVMTRKIKLILYHQSANQALPWKLTPAGTCIKCLPVVSIELSKPMLLTKICRTRTRSGFALMASLPAAKQRPLHAILIDINSYIRHTNVISRTTIKKIVH